MQQMAALACKPAAELLGQKALLICTYIYLYYGQQCQLSLIQCMIPTVKHFSLIYDKKIPPFGRKKVIIAITIPITGNDTLYSGRWITMFQNNMLPLSSGLNVKMESACTFKIVVPIYRTIW